jgi:hypothetical protein
MRKFFIPAAALFLAVSAAPVMAQDTLVSKGDVAMKKPTFETMISAMAKTDSTVNELLKRQTITEDEILVVDSKPLIEGKGDEMLKIQMDRNKGSIKQLQEVLKKHPAVEARLKKESASPDIDEIIAAEIIDNNRIQLYYRKD